ncbi:MAG: twin-arginine translocase subunit TatC [Dethiobacter sp.]|jgi:sec-independent protein translocase protein TatC|nr:MAG: twin-arginine translocase subunit TatC [Dethiobacter sp.]
MASKKKKTALEMSFFDHLDELRKRLIAVAIVILVASVICFSFVNQILDFLTMQAGSLELIYTTPAEAFMSQMRLAFTAGALITLPFTLHQMLSFIMPALRQTEKKIIILLLISMIFLFFLGMLFGYYVVFPYALAFFLGFAREGLLPLFSISRYISFVVSFLVAFGVVFQVPLIFWFLGRMSIISSSFLRVNRKYAVLIMAILSAVITPPDVFSQLLMLGPLMVLYEVGLLLVRVTERSRARMEEAHIQ